VSLIDTEHRHVVILEAVLKNVPKDVTSASFRNFDAIDAAHRQVELLVDLKNVCRCICTPHNELVQKVHDLLVIIGLAH